MKNRPRLLCICMILVFVAITIILNLILALPIYAFALCSLLYWLICIEILKDFAYRERMYNCSIISGMLDHDYKEVVLLHPHRLAICSKMVFEGPLKAYARISMGYVHVRIVSRTRAYKIYTNDWTWFYCNFAEKEPK